MERNGGNDVRTCTSDDISAVGVWSGTAPNCTGMYYLHIPVQVRNLYMPTHCFFCLQLRRCIYLMGTHTTMPTILPSSFQALWKRMTHP